MYAAHEFWKIRERVGLRIPPVPKAMPYQTADDDDHDLVGAALRATRETQDRPLPIQVNRRVDST